MGRKRGKQTSGKEQGIKNLNIDLIINWFHFFYVLYLQNRWTRRCWSTASSQGNGVSTSAKNDPETCWCAPATTSLFCSSRTTASFDHSPNATSRSSGCSTSPPSTQCCRWRRNFRSADQAFRQSFCRRYEENDSLSLRRWSQTSSPENAFQVLFFCDGFLWLRECYNIFHHYH